MGALLLQLAIEETPTVIEALRALFVRNNPDASVPTDQEIIDAYQAAFVSSVAKDDQWLAAHPPGDVG